MTTQTPVQQLADVLEDAGLMPLVALDVAEAIATDKQRLLLVRTLTGDLMLDGVT